MICPDGWLVAGSVHVVPRVFGRSCKARVAQRAAGFPHHQRAGPAVDAAEALAGDHVDQPAAGLAAERLEVHVDAGQRRARRLAPSHPSCRSRRSRRRSGTAMPRSRSASATPRAIWSLPQKIASGGAARPREELGDGLAAPGLRPDAGQVEAVRLGEAGRWRAPAIAVAAEPHGLEMLGSGDMGDAAAAEPREMLDGERARRLRRRAGGRSASGSSACEKT